LLTSQQHCDCEEVLQKFQKLKKTKKQKKQLTKNGYFHLPAIDCCPQKTIKRQNLNVTQKLERIPSSLFPISLSPLQHYLYPLKSTGRFNEKAVIEEDFDRKTILVNEVMSKDNGDPFPQLKEYVLLELFCCSRTVLAFEAHMISARFTAPLVVKWRNFK
jgi:hypothetical protein